MRELRVMALIKYLGIEQEEIINSMLEEESIIKEVGYRENQYEYNNMEYIVLTDDEADNEHLSYIQDLFDDLGLGAFTQSAQETIIDYYANTSWFDDALRESYSSYIDDIKIESSSDSIRTRLEEEMEDACVESEDEYLDFLCNQWKDGVEWYVSCFGKSEFYNISKQVCTFDMQAISDYCIRCDGRGHTLSSYDGFESEIVIDGESFFIYRVR